MDVVAGPRWEAFEEACRQVVAHLKAEIPFACWSVTLFDDDHQVHLWLDDDFYGLRRGHAQPLSETFCQYMVAGLAPQLAPDAMSVPRYAAAAEAAGMSIGAYAGVPIRDDDGELFGTLCGFDPEVRGEDLLRHGPLLRLMAGLLGRTEHVERRQNEAVVAVDELRWSAMHDPVTGLASRSVFLDALADRAARADAVGPQPALVLLSAGALRRVNAAHGEAVGDRLLSVVAQRLSEVLHPFDTVSRLAGEEFAILVHDAAALAATAACVDDALRAPVDLGGTAVPLAPVAGVALLDGADRDELLARARRARDGPARTGRVGGWIVLDPASSPGVAELRAALRSGSVDAAFQPIVRMSDGRLVAHEALARWTHDGVAVAPDVFVPLAAGAGLMAELTDRMLDQAAAQVAAWSRELGHRRLKVGVNVAPGLLLDPGFPDRVAERIRRYGLAPRQLVLEITEDALLDDLPRARAGADRLCALDVILCLDDVGSGYSSLLHLRHLPFEVVKVDRAFVDDIDSDPDARRFLAAVLTCGRDLGLRVVAEGVERAGQLDVLRSLGVDLVQGHHIGRPVRPDEVPRLFGRA
ncbi:hypothetical protein GCM10017691_26960 [Pseudonocardia petroleophila]|uniref:EAL domain-containing protein n=1 Tax=Pseudonocardia petroleophila TaxID=37331 RepID=A0A7G7MF44_9PSEU|nr:EAL domain-containing protein [Pseudonocardia petroleophila]QNG51405.1 EAL domain-containing protein [Pseudonocardia petroleophila]